MEGRQEINCNVESCKYNNKENSKCKLEAIQVMPIEGVDTRKPDESMCATYEHVND